MIANSIIPQSLHFHAFLTKLSPFNSTKAVRSSRRVAADLTRCEALVNQASKAIQIRLPTTSNPADAAALAVHEANQSIKQALKRWKFAPRHQIQQLNHLSRQLMSLQLGGSISAELLAKHPAYEKFIRKNYLHHSAFTYQQQWPVVNGEPGIIFNGVGHSFTAFKALSYNDGSSVVDKNNTLNKVTIVRQGLVHRSDALFPLISHDKQDPATWGNRHVVELITAVKTKKRPTFFGDHAWLRLRTPEGTVCSYGLYRPRPKTFSDTMLPFKTRSGGVVHNPDQFETINPFLYSLKSTYFNFTKEQFDGLLADMKMMDEKGNPYSSLKNNCASRVVQLLAKQGIRTEASIPMVTMLQKKLIAPNISEWFALRTPKPIAKTLQSIAQLGVGLLLLQQGSGHVSRAIKQAWGSAMKADYRWKQLFTPSQQFVDHPHTLWLWQCRFEK